MPKVSVIITTYDRARLMDRTIESLSAQTFSDFELLLIDNSTKNITPEILKKFSSQPNLKIRYYVEPIQGKCRAVNMGINYAKGEIIAFTDDDVIADPNWLTNIVKCFEELQCDGIGGRVLPIYPKETPPWVKNHPDQMAGTVVTYDQGDKIRPADSTLVRFIGCNWAFKRSIFTDCGLFRTDRGPGTSLMGEDVDFYYRILHKNKKLYYCPQVIIYHPVDLKRLSLKNTANWHIALGRYMAQENWENKNKHYVYWFGVPRYLWRGIIFDFLRLCASVFHRLTLHNACRKFFCKLGMICEYRKIAKEGKIA